ncbi:ArsR family transcriptional regulator [Natronolimnobius sp. AArcel1]|uniref:DUF7344 domain-containing protein n=1 Tax=Natronolimnobius sp. AArcel1 TaxID=1679093 RepID=UPI0013ED6E1A|nr:ArsR family transcriptional regulator [Natronolimnobius sp. AArcel1]NGM71257.1 ArsR family transcriptional regulator [Natronolimnobius sp. AArcel1]
MTRSNESSERLVLDDVLEILADVYRRRVLVEMRNHNPLDDDDAQLPADVIIADDDLAALRTQMRHVHLPKLEDAGLVEWDRKANVLRKGPRFDEIRPLLKLMADHADELPDDWI